MTEVSAVTGIAARVKMQRCQKRKLDSEANAPFPNALQCYTFCTDRFFAISVAGERYLLTSVADEDDWVTLRRAHFTPEEKLPGFEHRTLHPGAQSLYLVRSSGCNRSWK
jgi:hypothetical protein